MEKIILLSGKAFNGKTESANYLQTVYELQGKRVLRMSFAYYLKNILKRFYGWDGVTKDDFWRGELQRLGTDKIRKELRMPLFHVGRVADDISVVFNDFDIVLIDDARFQNEIDYMKAMFPKMVETIRVYRLGFQTPLSVEQQNHPSEIDLDDYEFDYSIYVQTGLQHLYDELNRALDL